MLRFSPVFSALNRSGSRYVIVDGVAVNLHGYVRGTTDIDVVLDLEREDALRAVQSLADLGYRPMAPLQAEDFADPTKRDAWIRDKGMTVFPMYNEQTK